MDRGDTHSVKVGIELLPWHFTRLVIIWFTLLNIWFILITLHDIIIFFNFLFSSRSFNFTVPVVCRTLICGIVKLNTKVTFWLRHILKTSFWHWWHLSIKTRAQIVLATERKILFQTGKTSFIHKVSQCAILMCTESETMCHPSGHFLIYSPCAQWRKKLHMCRKMHNIDTRKRI